MRFIFLAVIVLLLVALVRHFLLGSAKRRIPPGAPSRGTMVRCEQCGLHIPAPEALRSNDKYFCSNNHLEEYLRTYRQ